MALFICSLKHRLYRFKRCRWYRYVDKLRLYIIDIDYLDLKLVTQNDYNLLIDLGYIDLLD